MDLSEIRDGDVRAVLERMPHAGTVRDTPLLGLGAVRTRLADTGTSATPDSLEWALLDLLSEIVTRRLNELRAADVVDHDPDDSHAVAAQKIQDDFAAKSREREAWCCVYYRFVSPHAFKVREIGSIARPNSRHGRKLVSRRTTAGVHMLVHALREHERAILEREARAADDRRGRSAHGYDTSANTVPHNLPLRRSSFVDRQQLLEQIRQALAAAPLVTLVGPGGVGKTRLALHFAWSSLAEQREGIWLVELSTLAGATPGDVARSVSDVLDVPEATGRTVIDNLVRAIGTREIVLVVDNCEHVVDAVCIVLAELAARCPNAHVLATSREPIGVEGERVLAVPPLALPDQDAPVEQLLRKAPPAVELFIDRARELHSAFTLDARRAAVVGEICRRLDGIPLAIELAAGRAAGMPIELIRDRLDDRFGLLTRGRSTVEPRHQTLRAAIDWSHDLLTEQQRVVFRRLAVFCGGWPPEAAASVCGDGELTPAVVEEVVADLVRTSLVTVFASDDQPRYRLLGSVRDYAHEKLTESDEVHSASACHLAWCHEVAVHASNALDSGDESTWMRLISAELDNVSAALDWGRRIPASRETAVDLGLATVRYWQVRGRFDVGRAHLTPLFTAAWEDMDERRRAAMADGLGLLAFNQGDLAAAQAHHKSALVSRRELGDCRDVAETLRNLGNVADEMGDYDRAQALYEEALQLWEQLEDAWGIAATQNNLGLVALRRADYGIARAWLSRSLGGFRSMGARWAEGVTLANLADIALDENRLNDARRGYDESLTIATELGDREGIGYAQTGLAQVAREEGDLASCRTHLRASLAELHEQGEKGTSAEWLEAAGALAVAEGRDRAAVQLYAAAEALRSAIGAPLSPKDAPAQQHRLAALRGRMSADAFASAWLRGSSTSWLAAADHAFEER